MNVLPKCPKCGEVALEVKKGENGWSWVEGDGRSYHVGGKMEFICGNGHKWEE